MTFERLGKSARRERILAELRANPAVRVAELARAFGVTTETVRRDLDALSDGGLVSRTYGGAALPPMGVEPAVNERFNTLVEERQRIARAAVALVGPQDVLMIDSGSTTWHLARRLAAECQRLTVITNGMAVATALAANPSLRIVVCPGDYAAGEGGVFGPETLAFLRRFHADAAFVGASGLTTGGPTEVHPGAAWVKRVMLERAGRRVLLIDRSKFDKRRQEVVCSLAELDDVVVDAAPPAELGAALAAAGVALHQT